MHTVFCRRKIVNSVPGHLHRGKAKQQGTDKSRTGLFLPQVNGAEAEEISRKLTKKEVFDELMKLKEVRAFVKSMGLELT